MTPTQLIFAGQTKRYHTYPGMTQTDAEHAWNVATIARVIYPHGGRDMLWAALHHDSAEYLTCDMPAPVKWQMPALGKLMGDLEARVRYEQLGLRWTLTEEETFAIEVADQLEGALFAAHQCQTGNLTAVVVYERYVKALQSKAANVVNDPRGKTIVDIMDAACAYMLRIEQYCIHGPVAEEILLNLPGGGGNSD